MPVSQWIRSSMCSYDPHTNIFENRGKVEDLPIQSPIPLSKTFCYFVVTQEEVSPTDGKGASVGLATCSVRFYKFTYQKLDCLFTAVKTNTNMFVNERLLYMVCKNEKYVKCKTCV
jgi:hypothetical protein